MRSGFCAGTTISFSGHAWAASDVHLSLPAVCGLEITLRSPPET